MESDRELPDRFAELVHLGVGRRASYQCNVARQIEPLGISSRISSNTQAGTNGIREKAFAPSCIIVLQIIDKAVNLPRMNYFEQRAAGNGKYWYVSISQRLAE